MLGTAKNFQVYIVHISDEVKHLVEVSISWGWCVPHSLLFDTPRASTI